MDIKNGEYVRTDKGNIGKLVEIRCGKSEDGEKLVDVYFLDNVIWTLRKYILKHSFEPIDLIEAGDYVNGHKVYESDDGLVIFNIDDFEYFVNPMGLELDKYRVVLEWQDENYFKSIVTKEQFERAKYIVGE